MKFTISETEVPGVWQVVFTGEVNFKARQAAATEGLQMINGKKFKGLLVDLTDAEIAMSINEEYEFGVAMSLDPQTSGIRVAFLHRPGKTHRSKFLETVETNRGMITSIHSNREKAMEWLSEKP